MTLPRLNAEQARRVEQAMPRVAALVRSLAPLMPHMAHDDLESAGYEGLVEAALRYDPAIGVPFAAFAHYRVRGAMIDAARRAEPLLRRRSRAIAVLHATQALLEQHERATPPADVVDPRSLRERVAAAAQLVSQATAAVLLSRARSTDPDDLVDGNTGAEERMLEDEQREALDRLLSHGADDDRQLILAIYFEGRTMQEYAATLGVATSTVSRRHARLLAQLAEAMTRALDRAPGG